MIRHRLITSLSVLAVALCVTPVMGQQLQLPDLSRLASSATEVVDVSVDQALLGLAAGFMSGTGNDAQIKSMMSSLKGIYVKSFTFDKDGAYDPAVLESVRRQLSTGQWSRLVSARSSADGSDTAVYLWRNGDRPGGLAVLTSAPRSLTVVNIVGMIDLEQLRSLQGQFGVPDLKIEETPRPRPKARQ